MGEVTGSTFMKLMEMLVEAVLLHGAEVWGCGGQLRPVENVQMRAGRIFLGVGRLHPLVSPQFEMNMLPVKWEAMKRSMELWVQVMRMANGRLLKMVMIEVREVWREEARGRSKLVMIGRLMDYECKARCVEVNCKRQRSMLAKMRGGTAELRIETGRWCGLERRENL